MCVTVGVVPYLMDVQGAGYYAAAAAFAGGLLLGFIAVGIEFAVCEAYALVAIFTEPPPQDTAIPQWVLLILYAWFAALLAVPTLAGAGTRVLARWLARRG